MKQTRPSYPFSALVGQDTMRTALLLAAVDGTLGVLLRGDRGAGKTTAARALAALLPDDAPFVDLPVGATEDRLLGGLDVERAMKGEPSLKPGLLAQAHGGVLYIDEVNLLPDHLADALLDAAASGLHVVERDGYSETHAARFVLIGSMNPEEGALRPQLLDRFALAVDVAAPVDAAERSLALERRLRFDADPSAGAAAWAAEDDGIRQRLSRARRALESVRLAPEILDAITRAVLERGVRSLRADLAVARAARALAALAGDEAVTAEHVEPALTLALAHRERRAPSPAPPPVVPPSPPSPPKASKEERTRAAERIFAPVELTAPAWPPRLQGRGPRGTVSSEDAVPSGPVVRARPSEAPPSLEVRATVVHALAHAGSPVPRVVDLHEKVHAPRSATRYIVVLDSSGSHAAHQRMRFVKGAVLGLLEASAGRADEVCLIVVRGAAARVLLEPTRDREHVRRTLAHVPTGGRTPLASGLEQAAAYVTPASVLVVVTDGRANVPTHGTDGWADAMVAASALRCPALVVDSASEDPSRPARELARALGAGHVALEDLGQADLRALMFSGRGQGTCTITVPPPPTVTRT